MMHRVEEEGVAYSHHVGIIVNAYADNAQSFGLCILSITAGSQHRTQLEKQPHVFNDDTTCLMNQPSQQPLKWEFKL